MTPQELEDEAARPRAPDYPGLSPVQRARGQRLALIHDMYRGEMATVAELLTRIEAGQDRSAKLAGAIEGMNLTRNLSMFGTVCGRECVVLQDHHNIEEQWMFPALMDRADPLLRRVIDRLVAEHQVIHDLIGALREAAIALLHEGTADQFAECATRFRALDRAIRSHFGYEESELADALAAHDIRL